MQLIPSTFIIAQSALEMKKVFIKQLLIVGSLCLAKKKRNLKPSYLPAFIFISATSKLLHYFLDFTAMCYYFPLILLLTCSTIVQSQLDGRSCINSIRTKIQSYQSF